MRSALAFGLVLAAGCGMGGDGGDDSNSPDAATSGDAAPACSVDVSFEPAAPTAGVGVTVRANGSVVNGVGAISYSWDVRDPNGAALMETSVALDGQDVTFPIEVAGPYRVILQVDAATYCMPYDEQLNVPAPGANQVLLRFRFHPGPNIDAPPQELPKQISGGAAQDLHDLPLGATPITTTVSNTGGAGIASYLRFTTPSDMLLEAYSVDTTGQLDTYVPPAGSVTLVVPSSPSYAPLRIAGWQSLPITVDGGTVVTGTILDSTGQPLAGARVTLDVDGVPSTVGTTAGNGTYALRARPGATTVVTVTPPDATGLPRLTATLGALASPLDIGYAAGITTRDLAGTVLRRGATPQPGARVTFVGTIAAAGTATMPTGGGAATGDVLITAVAGGGGVLPTTRAPARPLAAVVVPTVNEAAVVAVDLTSGAPATIDAPAMAALTARVIGPSLEAVAGARVTAIPTGALRLGAMMPATAVAAGDGTVTLLLAPGGIYDLVVDDPHQDRARRWLTGLTVGALGDVALDGAIRITGTLKRPDGGAAGWSGVEVFCTECAGLDAMRPLAEGSTNAAGDFMVAVPDPGVALQVAPPRRALAPITVPVSPRTIRPVRVGAGEQGRR